MDCVVSLKNNVKLGKAKVVIIDKGNFTGKRTLTFTIKVKATASGSDIGSGLCGGASQPICGSYVLNSNTGVFHYALCSSVSHMNSANKAYINSRSDAVGRGYRACGNCRP